MGILYLVATPIGNLEDISARALRILREVQLIAAEDTRHTRKLLAHFDIHTPLTSYHQHSQPTRLEQILSALEKGDVALVSDAGTPALNDPGYELVCAALDRGFPVSTIPGPCAPIAALVVSGLPTGQFTYYGYLPPKAGQRRRMLREILDHPRTLIFLEAPHRLRAALEDIQNVLGDRQIAIARELTKLHEEVFRGQISAAQTHFASKEPLGEFTLVIAGKVTETEPWPEGKLYRALTEHLASGESSSQIAASLAAQSGWSRRVIYQLINETRKTTEE